MKNLSSALALTLVSLVAVSTAACDNNNNTNDSGTFTLPEASTTDVAHVTPDVLTTPDVVVATPDVVTPVDDVVTTVIDAGGVDAVTTETGATDAGGGYVDGCYVGAPRVMADWLNRCSSTTAFPARAARGAHLRADGGVDPLP